RVSYCPLTPTWHEGLMVPPGAGAPPSGIAWGHRLISTWRLRMEQARLYPRSPQRRPWRSAVLAVAFAALLGSASAQTLTMAMAAQPDTLDPQVTSATAAFQVAKSLYDTLVEVDQSGEIVPALAESYEVGDDSLSYTFHLVEATFHDGTTLDAADVVASLDRIRSPDTASPKASEFAAITSVEAVDDRTVVVHLSQPAPALLATLASGCGAIRPSEQVASGHDFGNQPLGTGPFPSGAWQRGAAPRAPPRRVPRHRHRGRGRPGADRVEPEPGPRPRPVGPRAGGSAEHPPRPPRRRARAPGVQPRRRQPDGPRRRLRRRHA